MTQRIVTALAAIALTLGAAGSAVAQNETAPARIPAAAALGASASPLIGQGYLPLPSAGEAPRGEPVSGIGHHARGRGHLR